MHYVYVLLSQKNQKRYIGFTSKRPEIRFAEHNAGINVFTRHNRPFELVYYEEHFDEDFARKRERFF